MVSEHKLFTLNIIVIVNFLFLKHFFYAKNEDKIACFCLFSWTLRTRAFHFSTTTENAINFLPNWVFLLLHGMSKLQVVINDDSHGLIEVLPLDLRSWHNWKVLVPMGTIFTTAVAKG